MTTRWHNCYDSNWNGFITKESYAHPAKFSRGLIERILDHMLARGWLRKGDCVADCFGGIGTGGIIAAYRGLVWVGVELEPRFIGFANANFALHRSKWESLGVPAPIIIQGDSRKFAELVGPIAAAISSPPYANSSPEAHGSGVDVEKNYATYRAQGGGCSFEKFKASREKHQHGYGSASGQIGDLKEGQVGAVISSPPFATEQRGGGLAKPDAKYVAKDGKEFGPEHFGRFGRNHGYQNQCESGGNIASLPAGEIAAVVSSPPWEQNCEGGVRKSKFNYVLADTKGHGSTPAAKRRAMERDEQKIYGESAGQIGQLSGGSVDAVVSSPPYISGGHHADQTGAWNTNGRGQGQTKEQANYGAEPGQIGRTKEGTVDAVVSSPPYEGQEMSGTRKALEEYDSTGKHSARNYGAEQGQIGREQSETYWQAVRDVYASVHQSLKPGGYIALVVKNYVKQGKIVPLCDDTVRLLEHLGFEIVERVHAMLTQETEHNDLFAGKTTTKRERKSFFRRLAEKKGSPAINWEEVIFARKSDA